MDWENERTNLLRNTQRRNSGVRDVKFFVNSWVTRKTEV
jgi:hypothetical protein